YFPDRFNHLISLIPVTELPVKWRTMQSGKGVLRLLYAIADYHPDPGGGVDSGVGANCALAAHIWLSQLVITVNMSY
ncbi:hypothetical protein ACUOCP_40515, partial [Escherichia sp. R-CC3]